MKLLPGMLALATSLAAQPVALADMVDPPRVTCPPGASAVATHSGGACEPDLCSGGACRPGTTCQPVKFCIVTEEYWKQGQTRMEREKVAGRCEEGRPCAGRCKAYDVCVPGPAVLTTVPPPPPVPAEGPRTPEAPAVPAPAPADAAPRRAFCAAAGGDLAPSLFPLLLLLGAARRRSPAS